MCLLLKTLNLRPFDHNTLNLRPALNLSPFEGTLFRSIHLPQHRQHQCLMRCRLEIPSVGRDEFGQRQRPTGFKCLKAKDAKTEVGIEPFVIPKRSPDLSVLDYAIWSQVNRRLRKQEKNWPKTKRETRLQYTARLRRTATRLPPAFVKKSIEDMKRRCQRLYAAKGGYFEEGGRRGC